MEINEVILAIVSTVGKVEGRKRLQKMIHLLQIGGIQIPTEFHIHHYGPFSEEVASTAESMALDGELDEEIEAVGPYNIYQYLYSAPRASEEVEPEVKELIERLNEFSTVELEVASTIAFFENEGGKREDAIEQTKFMKPSKTTSRVLRKAEEILAGLQAHQR